MKAARETTERAWDNRAVSPLLTRAKLLVTVLIALLVPLWAWANPASSTKASAPSACVQFAAKLPNVSKTLCDSALLKNSGVQSVRTQTLWTRDVQPADAQTRVLVVGGIHGDELSSASLALHWIQNAVQTPAQTHWRFIPLLNPDGLLSSPPQRTNARGVDLNRNFPTPNWDKEAPIYWEQRVKRDPRRWPGPKPLSEPESQFLHDEMQSFKPHLIVSIHAPYGVLDFDGPIVPPSKLGRLYLDQVGIFPGSLGNYGGVHKRMPVVTIELPSAFRTPLESEMRQMWLDLLRWKAERISPNEATPVKAQKTAATAKIAAQVPR
jgi:murein peptide amidase A